MTARTTIFGLTFLSLMALCASTAHAGGNQPYLVKDIRPASSSNPDFLTKVGNGLYFNANDGVNGRELWVSDGTESSTYMVLDGNPGSESGSALSITNVMGRAFFQIQNAAGGWDLWVADGTPDGTAFVVNLSIGNYFHQMEGLGEILLFRKGRLATPGLTDLWRTNGTPAGTAFVKNINVNDVGTIGTTQFLAAVGPGDFVPGYDFWVTDGSTAGTEMLADLRGCIFLTPLGNGVAFNGDEGEAGREPWVSDGTIAGTRLLKDIWPGSGWSDPNCFSEIGGRLYFNAFNPTIGRELWVSDGTEEGTTPIDIFPGAGSGGGCEFVSLNGEVFFRGTHETLGVELWKTDGTPEGTTLVKDIHSGPENSELENFIVSGGRLYFHADDGIHGRELWVTNGTSSGTHMLAEIVVGPDPGVGFSSRMVNVNGVLFFVGNGSPTFGELWAYDSRPDAIPTMTSWGLLSLGLVVMCASALIMRRVKIANSPDILEMP